MQLMHISPSFEESPVALLYDRYAPLILSYVSRYVYSNEDADDIVLEVFVAAWEKQVWSNKIAFNTLITYKERASEV